MSHPFDFQYCLDSFVSTGYVVIKSCGHCDLRNSSSSCMYVADVFTDVVAIFQMKTSSANLPPSSWQGVHDEHLTHDAGIK